MEAAELLFFAGSFARFVAIYLPHYFLSLVVCMSEGIAAVAYINMSMHTGIQHMHIHIYIYTYIYIHNHMHMHTHRHILACLAYIYEHASRYALLYAVCMFDAVMHVSDCIYVCMYVCMRACVRACNDKLGKKKTR